MNRIFLILPLAIAALNLAGCVPLVAGGAAVVGTTAAQERSMGNAVDDMTINTKITNKYVQKQFEPLFTDVDVDVNEGRVLLTGSVKNPETRKEAERLAWEVPGVREVINEIQVTSKDNPETFLNDGWITTQVKSRLLFTKNIRSVNYGVDTVNGVVYLMGIAQNKQELEAAAEVARRTKGVRKVVSHVIIKDDPRRPIAPPPAPSTSRPAEKTKKTVTIGSDWREEPEKNPTYPQAKRH